MLVFSRSSLPLTIACVAILSGFPQAQVSLSGTVLKRDGTGKAGVSVTLASSRQVAITNDQGAWTLGSTTGVQSARTPSTRALTQHLALLNGSHLRLSFQGFDAFGRSAGGRYVALERLGRGAARAQGAFDTLVYSIGGKVFLRDTLTSLVQTGIVREFDTTINPAITYGFLTDTRDGQIYRTVKIGSQTWMAQNLNYGGTNGATGVCPGIPGSTTPGNADSCAKYGRFYTWASMLSLDDTCNTNLCASQVQLKRQGICPAGWHVPADSEWTNLVNTVEADARFGNREGGRALKSMSGWSWGNQTDVFGFSVLSASSRHFDGSFGKAGEGASFWSGSEYNAPLAWGRHFDNSYDFVNSSNGFKAYGFSLRCTQD